MATETGTTFSYDRLDRRVDRTAACLRDLGIRAGDHLATLLPTRVETVEVVHAATRLGAVLVPLDPNLPPGTLGDRLRRADVSAVICQGPSEALALEAVAAVDGPGGTDDGDRAEGPPVASVDDPNRQAVVPVDPGPDHVPPGVEGRDGDGNGGRTREDGAYDRRLADEDGWRSVRPRRRSLDAPAAIMFTSGTTGDPKAVELTVGNLFASAVTSAFRLGVVPDDRWFCELPAYHMGGLAPFLRTAIYGTTAVLQRRRDGFDLERTLANLREYDATGVSLVPTQLGRLLDAGELPASLRFVLLGGGPAPDDLIERCARRDVPVCPTYGMTETASQVATARPSEATEHVGTVGRPLAATDVTVLDTDGDPLPPGELGEVVVDGPTVTPGYYDDPERTAAAVGEYGLHTGDLGRLDEAGRLWIHGRIDDRIVTGGENVDPTVVAERVRDHDAVEDAAVVGLPDPEWGQRVAALVVPVDTEGLDGPAPEAAGLTPSAIREACRGSLAPHELPKTVAFADSLPRTPSETVDREAVAEAIRTAVGEE